MPASVAPSAGQRPRHGYETRRIAPAAETRARANAYFRHHSRRLVAFWAPHLAGFPALRRDRPMRDQSGRDIPARTLWLLAIGKRLRAEYDALEEPVPARLAALVKRLTDDAAGALDEEAS